MRQCGGCTLCCKLVPVKEIEKRGGVRCQHQRTGRGCAVHNRPGMPVSCRLWSCLWLSDPATAELSRPDRTHYVIDVMPDTIIIRPPVGGQIELPVLQVWLDPKFPTAHHDPALRAYLAMRGRQDGMAAIMRWDERNGFVLFPPALTPDGKWREDHNGQVVEREALQITRNYATHGDPT